MLGNFDSRANYEKTLKEAGYVSRLEATQETYDRIGFMSGLEVHQQLLTTKKLFCHCPAGIYHDDDEFDAEIIRHMRPTLSELGEYDGTALMEFKTRKEIIYRIKNITTCTYEIDDTPPFPINREALEISIKLALMCKMNIVGEVHITRKQYLDGSIPTGFQRTAIVGVGGEIPLKNRKVRLMQLSVEEDSCREISDIGHVRVYKTDRLGMPLIETVTYPDMKNPNEVKEACDYIRFLNRSSGLVRTGIGASRQDVNVSCRGGTRVEIKGVSHTKWIPELTHNEVFRQWSLLLIRNKLLQSVQQPDLWKIEEVQVKNDDISALFPDLAHFAQQGFQFHAIRLPGFRGILSHFTQPGRVFADEISDRLKVIACIEKPNMQHAEEIFHPMTLEQIRYLESILKIGEQDSFLLLWGPQDDIPTALETVEERCKLAFKGVPPETRKSFPNGTTMFERVLPGPDRMYPDTDSAPIPLSSAYIESLKKDLPEDVFERMKKMKEWGIGEHLFTYILSKNLFPLLEEISNLLSIPPKWIGHFLGQFLKYVEGHYKKGFGFNYHKIKELFVFLRNEKIDEELAYKILPVLYEHPQMDFHSILTTIGFKRTSQDELMEKIRILIGKFHPSKRASAEDKVNWVLGQIRYQALGNVKLTLLAKTVIKEILGHE
ncbi:MAG: Glu-tRNA(Gln) amidotransferase subunit GatE [Bacteroidales bacterium]|nr:Glu-tRNA(Gln) amidotransferase subunit GatE [Bacteroidales bacterium]